MEPDEGNVIRRGLGVLFAGVREEPRIFVASVAGSFVYGAMIIVQSYLLGAITTHVITPDLAKGHAQGGALAICAGVIMLVSFVKIAGIIARRMFTGVMQYRLQASYRRKVTRRYLALPLAWHAQHSTGELLSNANSDVEAAWYPVAPFPFAVGVLVVIFVTIGLLCAINVLLALVACLIFPAVIVANARYARIMSPLVGRSQQLRGEVSGMAHESFEGALVVKTLGREDHETERFATRTDDLRAALVSVGRLRGSFDPLLDAIPNLGVLLVLLIGATRVSTGNLVQVAYLFSLMAFPLRAIGWVLAEMPRSIVGWQRVQRVLGQTGAMPYGEDTLPSSGAGGAALAVSGLSFAYLGHPPVLRDISFDVAPQKTIAIVGATGAGKSTLTNLIVRLIDPDGGTVHVDGHDARTLAAGELAGTAALVAQSAFVFDDTVRGNVTLGTEFADEQVWAALRIAQADGFVAALPHGLDTLVGERGTTLSGGQRQRLSLARALIRRPRLLVLDDATSAVDTSVEQAILAGLRRDVGATTVVVAYRKATIALADEVLFVHQGRIAARGTHAELLTSNAGYRRIVNAYDSVEVSA